MTFAADRRTEAGKYMAGSGKFVSSRTGSPASFLVASQNSRNNHLPEKFNQYRKRRRTYLVIEIDENDTKVSLFYLMHPVNSKSLVRIGYSREIWVLFCQISLVFPNIF